MIQRVLSGITLILLCVVPIYFGGIYLNILLGICSIIAGYEFISIRERKFNFLLFFIIELFILLLMVFPNNRQGLIIILLVSLFLCSILFEDISFDDIASTFAMALLIGFALASVKQMYQYRGHHLNFLYVALATYACDSGAYFVGIKFGKHKLIERVSPKKTVEGAIGGFIFGFLISFLYVYIFKEYMINELSIEFYLITSLILPLVAQVGDLSFSLVKRNYRAKDFGSLIPGHGGILDRIDSLIFTLIAFISMLGFIL